MGLQTSSLESGLPEAELTAPCAFGDDPAEALLDEGFQSGPLPVCQLARLLEEAVWYLYGCLHMAKYIGGYAHMSNGNYPRDWTRPTK